jgi:hypothetical protein
LLAFGGLVERPQSRLLPFEQLFEEPPDFGHLASQVVQLAA